MIPLLDLKAQYQTIKKEIDQAVAEVLEEQIFILGPRVRQLEEAVARYSDVSFAVGVASGTDALLLSLMAVGVGYGDEVITTPYTFFATAGSVSRLGAKPVFVDIDPRTYNINPALIEEKITPRTKAVIPVHLFGQCAEMDPILEITKKHRLFCVEDAAQAVGATYRGKKAGSMGDLGIISFFPSKNLGGFGDGGMVLTRSPELADRVRTLRVHGAKPKYFHEVIGCCSRLDAIQAAVLLVKLKYLDQWSEKRRRNAKRYNELFKGTGVQTPFIEEFNISIFNQYIIRVERRDALKAFLEEKGITTGIYYPVALHLQKCYEDLGYRPGDFPQAEKAARETLALPVYPELTETQQKEVAGAIGRFFGAA